MKLKLLGTPRASAHTKEALRDEDVLLAVGADQRSSIQGLRKVREDGRSQVGLDALQLSGSRDVKVLCRSVEQQEREDDD